MIKALKIFSVFSIFVLYSISNFAATIDDPNDYTTYCNTYGIDLSVHHISQINTGSMMCGFMDCKLLKVDMCKKVEIINNILL